LELTSDNVCDNDPLVAEETFGPIMPLLPWKDEADLVARVNSTPYGLQAGVFTDSMAAARRLFEYDPSLSSSYRLLIRCICFILRL
jgi:acyl-CoA reductase-like NAD-dependent aldehyde dehydrogenase